MRCIYIYIYYSAIKKNEILPLVTTWIFILGEVSQIERDKYHMIMIIGRI